MPWCPKCKAEYREEFEMCSACDVKLVEQLEPEHDEHEEWVFLINVADGVEADLVEGFIKSGNIPVLRNYKGAGDYLKIYMGMSHLGVDLLVPLSRLEEAKEMIASKPVEIFDEEKQEHEPEMQVEEEKNRNPGRTRAQMILVWRLLPVAIAIVLWLIWLLIRMRQ